MQRFAARDYWLFPFGLGKLYKQMFKGVGPLDWMEFVVHLMAIGFISDFIYPGNLLNFLIFVIVGLLLPDRHWLLKFKYSKEEFIDKKEASHRGVLFGTAIAMIVFIMVIPWDYRFSIYAFTFSAVAISHPIIDAIFRRLKEKY